MNRPGEDTLIRYFRGQCPPEESAAVELYLAMGTDADYVKECLREAWGDLQQPPGMQVSAERLEARWQQLATYRKQHTNKPVIWKVLLRYAAVIAFFLTGALTYWLLKPGQKEYAATVISCQTFSAPKGQPKKLRFEDGSVVTLFPGAEIQVPDDYNQHKRTITLKGRAFFEIAKDAQRPFYVETAHLSTRVLGTAFDVNTSGRNAISSITLLNGRIAVSHAMKEIATLVPGQQVVFDSITQHWQVNRVNARDVTAWTNGEFIYEHTTLQQVFRDIEDWYDVNIQVKHSFISGKEITTNFKGLPLEQVLTLISKASGFRYVIKGKQVLVTEATQ